MAKRPKLFQDFHGQVGVVDNLKVLAASALRQDKPLAHVLLVGPAGLGKSTLGMHILPVEMGTEVTFVNCAAIEKPQQLTTVLATMGHKHILFLDELHALPPACREHLLTAMEDFTISVVIGEGDHETVMEVALQHFSVIAATTRQGALDAPLRTRFQQILRLEPYTDEEMCLIISFHNQEFELSDRAIVQLAGCAKGIARNGVNLLQSTVDTAVVEGETTITEQMAIRTLKRLGYQAGLSPEELSYLTYLSKVDIAGLNTLATALDETQATVEEVYEPWLLRKGYIARGSRGRYVTEEGKKIVFSLGGKA